MAEEGERNSHIIGKQIFLRPLREEDATLEYLAWLNDPEVTKYIATRSSTFDELRAYIREKVKDSSCIFWGIFVGPQEKHIGNVKLYDINSVPGEATIGIMIGDKNYWGKGIGKEAIRLAVDYAFLSLNLNRVSLVVASENIAAMKAYEWNQFKVARVEEKGLVYGDKLYDKVIMIKEKIAKENGVKEKQPTTTNSGSVPEPEPQVKLPFPTFTKSNALLHRAKQRIPSAAQTYSKSYLYFCENAAPAFLDHGEGGYVWDVDGNKYLDFVMGLGAVTLGYNNVEINEAISQQLKKGISFSLATALEVELAEKLCSIIPSAEMVRFAKNGSDATTAAVRLARAYTGREIVAYCGYHGYHDWFIGLTENNAGVPKAVQDLTKRFAYNDITSLQAILNEYKGKVAAVILEPCQQLGPAPHFLQDVQRLAQEEGAVLIFDEVVSGFRLGISGAQGQYKVTPDLTALGKGMANGVAISAVVGKAAILQLIDRGAFISTTFGGETLGIAAALKTIEILERSGAFPHIIHLGNLWLERTATLIKEKGLESTIGIIGVSPRCGVVFKDNGSLLFKNELFSLYQQELVRHGILNIGMNNFCLAHTEEDVQYFMKATEEALTVIAEAVRRKSTVGLLQGEPFRPVFRRN